MPRWGLSDDGHDFGHALLKVASLFNARVAERFDQCGDKMRRGFFDWLAMRGDAARPARMPVVFKMVEKAQEAVLARAPVQMQASAQGAAVVFETENDVRVLPGRLEIVVATDAENDAIFFQMPELTSIEPLEPLPTQWRLKSFAAAGSDKLQLDPEVGLVAGMIVEVAGLQYRIEKADKDIATIDPALPAGAGVEAGTIAEKVRAFEPFDPQTRNRQDHVVYLGDLDLLNIEAAATIDVAGGQALGPEAQWAYWGKKGTDDTVGWQPLTLAKDQPGDAVRFDKPKGAVEPREIGAVKSARWIRASTPNVQGIETALSVDSLELRINCRPAPACPTVNPSPGAALACDAMANTTPLALTSPFFYPLGRIPRQFDTFYLGCPEAFSKPGAHIQLCFDLKNPTPFSLSAVHHAALAAAPILAGVGQDGALHLFSFDAAQAKLTRLFDGEPLQPPSPAYGSGAIAAPSIALDRKPRWRLPTWAEDQDFMIAVAAGSHVWVWGQNATDSTKSGWRDFGALPTDAPQDLPVDGLVYLEETASPSLVALQDGKLYLRATVQDAPWSAVPTQAGSPVVVLKAIAPILVVIDPPTGQLASSAAEGMVGIANDGKLYTVTIAGECAVLAAPGLPELSTDVRPIALKDDDKLTVVAASQSRTELVAVIRNGAGTTTTLGDLDGCILGFSLEAALDGTDHLECLVTVRDGPNSYFATWVPPSLPLSAPIEVPPAASGAPTHIAQHVLIPGENADVLVRPFVVSTPTPAAAPPRSIGPAS